METRADESQEVQLPSEHVAVVAMFTDRDEAESAVDALKERGFADDEIALVARGASTDDSGGFVPGGVMVTVRAKAREAEAERVRRARSARGGTTNRSGGTGKVGVEA